jgi:hypothetical protein
MQLNIKLYGTLAPLLLYIQLNFKPYVRMRLWDILYNISQRRPFWTVYGQCGVLSRQYPGNLQQELLLTDAIVRRLLIGQHTHNL